MNTVNILKNRFNIKTEHKIDKSNLKIKSLLDFNSKESLNYHLLLSECDLKSIEEYEFTIQIIENNLDQENLIMSLESFSMENVEEKTLSKIEMFRKKMGDVIVKISEILKKVYEKLVSFIKNISIAVVKFIEKLKTKRYENIISKRNIILQNIQKGIGRKTINTIGVNQDKYLNVKQDFFKAGLKPLRNSVNELNNLIMRESDRIENEAKNKMMVIVRIFSGTAALSIALSAIFGIPVLPPLLVFLKAGGIATNVLFHKIGLNSKLTASDYNMGNGDVFTSGSLKVLDAKGLDPTQFIGQTKIGAVTDFIDKTGHLPVIDSSIIGAAIGGAKIASVLWNVFGDFLLDKLYHNLSNKKIMSHNMIKIIQSSGHKGILKAMLYGTPKPNTYDIKVSTIISSVDFNILNPNFLEEALFAAKEIQNTARICSDTANSMQELIALKNKSKNSFFKWIDSTKEKLKSSIIGRIFSKILSVFKYIDLSHSLLKEMIKSISSISSSILIDFLKVRNTFAKACELVLEGE